MSLHRLARQSCPTESATPSKTRSSVAATNAGRNSRQSVLLADAVVMSDTAVKTSMRLSEREELASLVLDDLDRSREEERRTAREVFRKMDICWDYPLSASEKRTRTIVLYEEELNLVGEVNDRLRRCAQRHRAEGIAHQEDAIACRHEVNSLRAQYGQLRFQVDSLVKQLQAAHVAHHENQQLKESRKRLRSERRAEKAAVQHLEALIQQVEHMWSAVKEKQSLDEAALAALQGGRGSKDVVTPSSLGHFGDEEELNQATADDLSANAQSPQELGAHHGPEALEKLAQEPKVEASRVASVKADACSQTEGCETRGLQASSGLQERSHHHGTEAKVWEKSQQPFVQRQASGKENDTDVVNLLTKPAPHVEVLVADPQAQLKKVGCHDDVKRAYSCPQQVVRGPPLARGFPTRLTSDGRRQPEAALPTRAVKEPTAMANGWGTPTWPPTLPAYPHLLPSSTRGSLVAPIQAPAARTPRVPARSPVLSVPTRRGTIVSNPHVNAMLGPPVNESWQPTLSGPKPWAVASR